MQNQCSTENEANKEGQEQTDRKVVNKWKQKLAERKDTKNRENPDENSVKQWTLAKTTEEANVKFWNRMTQIRKHTKPRRKQTSNTWKIREKKSIYISCIYCIWDKWSWMNEIKKQSSKRDGDQMVYLCMQLHFLWGWDRLP